MKSLIRRIQPKTFEDIAATIALFRPGPMENIPEYLRCRENPALVHYPHPSLEPILKNTYGIMIYQEQVMQVCVVMGGFSLAEADSMRKAISKKKGDALARDEKMFIDGAVKKGYTKELGAGSLRSDHEVCPLWFQSFPFNCLWHDCLSDGLFESKCSFILLYGIIE